MTISVEHLAKLLYDALAGRELPLSDGDLRFIAGDCARIVLPRLGDAPQRIGNGPPACPPGAPSAAAIEAAAQAYGEQWGDPPWDDLPEAEQEATRLILGVILRVAYAVDGAASSDDRALREALTAASELVFASIGETTYGQHGAQRAVSVHYTDEQFKRLMAARTVLAHLIESHGAALAGAAPSAPPQ